MLAGKVALVTGGSSGIGKAIARRFAAGGAKVAVVASADVSRARKAADEIKAAGGDAAGYAADVRDPAQVSELVSRVGADMGRIDLLVTAAGIFEPTPIGTGAAAVFDRTIDTNLKAVFHCIDAVVPMMKSIGGGRIIAISSVAAQMGVNQFSAYCASKAAVSMLVRSLALELAPLNININAIAPGNTATPMNEAMRTDPAQAAFLDGLRAATPSTRIFSEPEDIAEMAWFLAGPAARAMHGSTVLMDEGISAGL